MSANGPDRDVVLEDIRALTAAPAPLLDQVERTLADGYACALALEAMRLRLQGRLEQRALTLTSASSPDVEEVAGLAQDVVTADEELAELRTALTGLAVIAQRLRGA